MPLLFQLSCKITLRRRRDQWLVGLCRFFEVGFASREILVDVRSLRIRKDQIVAQHRAKPCGLHPHLADPPDAGQPLGLDILGGRVDGTHLQECKAADERDHQKQKRNDREKLGANGKSCKH